MTHLMIFALAGVGVYLIRVSGLALAGGSRELPQSLAKLLRLVAPAAVTAVVASAVLLDGQHVRAVSAWHVAALVAIALAAWRRHMALTLGVGALTFASLTLIGV